MAKGYLWTGTVNGNQIQLVTEDEEPTENSKFSRVYGINPSTGNYVIDLHGFLGNITGMTATATTPATRVDYNKPNVNVTVKYMHDDNNTRVLDETVHFTDFNTSLEELMATAFDDFPGSSQGVVFYIGDGETEENLTEFMRYSRKLSLVFQKESFRQSGESEVYNVEAEKFGKGAIGLTITAEALEGLA